MSDYEKPRLSVSQIVNMNVGFLGLQFSFGLQQANMSPIYAYLGADALLLQRLEAAGAVLVGSLNMDEYAYGFTTENSHYGATANPHDPSRISGGSSGGNSFGSGGGTGSITLEVLKNAGSLGTQSIAIPTDDSFVEYVISIASGVFGGSDSVTFKVNNIDSGEAFYLEYELDVV